ncbi:MAG: hypothetical protein IT349_19470 [Candidatus Eisenbacteria bacterium]|nr:hypothetical protein [Candidatus Eisenbacteria bacterium]
MTPDLKAVIERGERALRAYVIDDESGVEVSYADLRALLDAVKELERDAERLRFVAELVDGIGDVDLYEEAGFYASAFGREEPNDSDYIAAVRTAIDAAIAKEQP